MLKVLLEELLLTLLCNSSGVGVQGNSLRRGLSDSKPHDETMCCFSAESAIGKWNLGVIATDFAFRRLIGDWLVILFFRCFWDGRHMRVDQVIIVSIQRFFHQRVQLRLTTTEFPHSCYLPDTIPGYMVIFAF